VRHFYDRRMGQEIDGEVLGEEFKGYLFKITGGNDKQGFPMKQGVMVNGRVRLLMTKRTTTYRPRRTGERQRKSVRGCILGPDIAVIALRIEKRGEADIDGVTNGDKPRRLGPKRAANIRKLFALRKDKDDVRKYVVKREIKRKDKTFYKAPKIQRLITEKRLRRKKLFKREKLANYKKGKDERAKYEKLLSQYIKEKKSLLDKAKAEKAGHEVEPVAAKKEPVPAKKTDPKAAASKADPKKGASPAKQGGKPEEKKGGAQAKAPAQTQAKPQTQTKPSAPAKKGGK